MQNKNRILKRGGFAAIAAVFLMLLISIMMLKMISSSTDTSKRTTNEYLYEQAVLLSYNVTEFTMLKISQADANTACVDNQTVHYPDGCIAGTNCIYDITVNVDYIWANGAVPGGTSCGGPFTVVTPEQDGSAYVDVVITSDPALHLDNPIRFHRRTLQKL